jgi:hypothetical protein
LASNGSGLICCGVMHHWKDLRTKIEDGAWTWIAPCCGAELRVDRYTPQTDLPRSRHLVLLTQGAR